jgi:hypothetical protein
VKGVGDVTVADAPVEDVAVVVDIGRRLGSPRHAGLPFKSHAYEASFSCL